MATEKMKMWTWCCAVTEMAGILPAPHFLCSARIMPSHSSAPISCAAAMVGLSSTCCRYAWPQLFCAAHVELASQAASRPSKEV